MRGATIIKDLTSGSNIVNDINWSSYKVPGREGVEIYPLYNTDDTGPEGPAAALVRYQPGARVDTHLHPGYELIYVIDGVLTNDEGSHYPGTLQICPPGSTHALSSEDGCTFLVVWEQPVKLLKKH